MTSDERTRKMLKELAGAGWAVVRDNGRHTMYGCPCGAHFIPVPTSHQVVSAGVVSKIRKAIAGCRGAGSA